MTNTQLNHLRRDLDYSLDENITQSNEYYKLKDSKEICQYCKKPLQIRVWTDGVEDEVDVYEYRGFVFHEECFDKGVELVEHRRKEVSQMAEASVRSQADGEWNNGGYKTMKVDKSGRPIPSKVKEPLALQEYESGKL